MRDIPQGLPDKLNYLINQVTCYQMISTNQDTGVFSIGDRDSDTKMSGT